MENRKRDGDVSRDIKPGDTVVLGAYETMGDAHKLMVGKKASIICYTKTKDKAGSVFLWVRIGGHQFTWPKSALEKI